MDPAINAVDNQVDALAQFLRGEPFGDNPTYYLTRRSLRGEGRWPTPRSSASPLSVSGLARSKTTDLPGSSSAAKP
jgi:hypothetical protein